MKNLDSVIFDIFNPNSVGSFSHCSSLFVDDKFLHLVWYGYPEDEFKNAKICYSRMDLEFLKWSSPVILFENFSDKSFGNPLLFKEESSGDLTCAFVILNGFYWNSSKICLSRLVNGIWEAPNITSLPLGMMLRHRPYNGLFPLYDENKNTTNLYKYSHNSFDFLTELKGNFIQGDIIPLSGTQEVEIYLRPAEDEVKYVHRAISFNSRKSFRINKTQMKCPLSGVAAILLENKGRLICHNGTDFGRSPLTLSFSKNGDVVFGKILDIETNAGEYSYPQFCQNEKYIFLSYTFNRKQIKCHLIAKDKFNDLLNEHIND